MGIIFYSVSKVGGGGMQYNRVEICGVNTSKLKVLKEKEKTELLRRMHSGDKSARDELINGNLRLVLSVVQRFTNRGENPDDLFQVDLEINILQSHQPTEAMTDGGSF